jgi:type VI secretion system secreted protein Hcp
MIRSLALVLGLTAFASTAFADDILVTAQGAKQGKFPGTAAGGKIAAKGFTFEVSAPRDMATGQASGKRQHKPIVFTKEWGTASPQFLQALQTNEVLSSVTLEFYSQTAKGTTELSHFIRLTNATVTDIKRYTSGATQLEDLSLQFQTIEEQAGPTEPLETDNW